MMDITDHVIYEIKIKPVYSREIKGKDKNEILI